MRFSEKQKKICSIFILILLLLIPITLVFNNNIWLDEGFSLRWSMLPFEKFIKRITLDVCPLYLICLRIILTITNNSLVAAKLFSVVAIGVIFYVGYSFVRKYFGYKALFFFCLFILFTPTMLEKTVEVRMYTWASMWVVLSSMQMYFLLQEDCKKRNWIWFILVSLAGAYTHYFAVLSLVVLYVGLGGYFLVKRNVSKIKNWLICCGVTIIGYLPWVPVILRQTKSETTSWIQPTGSYLGTMFNLFNTNIPRVDKIFIIFLILAFLFGLYILFKYKTFEGYWSVVCMAAIWVILTFGYIFENIARPILVGRYLLIPLCICIMGMSCLCKYIPRYIAILGYAFLIVVGVYEYRDTFEKEYNTLTDITLEFAEENIEYEDVIVRDTDSLSSVLPYYFPNATILDDVEKVYSEDFDGIWYFDSMNSLDLERLDNLKLNYTDYGKYGLDFVEFTIYYVYRQK